MLNKNSKIGVTSRTFCRSRAMRQELEKSFYEIKYNDKGSHFDEDSLIEFLNECDGAIISGEPLTKKVLRSLPNLKVISKFGVGVDNIDFDSVEDENKEFFFQPGVNANSVAELTLGYLIILLREAYVLNRGLISGNWGKVTSLSRELSESTVGIIGYGQIGKRLQKYLTSHQCEVIIYDPYLNKNTNEELSNKLVSTLDELLGQSDAVTLHLPLTNATENIINHKELKMMKRNSVLLNLSRGGLVSEDALYESLISGHLAGAALDVHIDEPRVNNKLIQLPNVFLSPHIAGTSNKSSNDLGTSAIQGLLNYIK